MRRAFIFDAWDRGDELAHRSLVANLFEELHVQEGIIAGYTLRRGNEAEITIPVEAVCTSSPGGIRADTYETLSGRIRYP